MNEQWKIIPEFPDYAISNHGTVKRITPGAGTYVGKVIKPLSNQTGCVYVIVGRKTRSISRLLQATFVPANPVIAEIKMVHPRTREEINAHRRAKHAEKRGSRLRKKLSPAERLGRDRAQARRYQATHRVAARIRLNKWRAANPSSRIPAEHERKARLKGNGGSWTLAEWKTLKRQYGHRCVGCWKTEAELKVLGRKLVPDQIIPVVEGGLNHITNLQPLCHGRNGCNNKKGAKYFDFVIS